MSIKITKHALDDKGIVSRTDNVANIVDKLIRLAAKLTEYYASDIMYDINALKRTVEEGKPHDMLLFFRECGVTETNTAELNDDRLDSFLFNFTPIQVWRLTHDPVEMETKLIRVNVYKEMIPCARQL